MNEATPQKDKPHVILAMQGKVKPQLLRSAVVDTLSVDANVAK